MTDIFRCDQCGQELTAADEVCANCSATLASDYIAPRPVKNDISFGAAIVSVIGRLVFGVVILVALAAVLLISAIPYGGGGGVVSVILVIATIAVPIWSLLPLLDVKRKSSSQDSPE